MALFTKPHPHPAPPPPPNVRAIVQYSLHEDVDPNSLAHAEVTFTLWGFCTGKFQHVADKTAGKLETALRVNKASAKVFEPRTS